MKNQIFLIIIIIAVFGITGFFLLTKNRGGGQINSTLKERSLEKLERGTMTAKQAYFIALSGAKKLASDNYLVRLNNNKVQKNGRSTTWFITFYSPSKNTNYRLTIFKGKVDKIDDKNRNETAPLSDEWIDSDQVARVAIPKCDKTTTNNFYFGLEPSESSPKKGIIKWTVECNMGDYKSLFIDVNAESGEFIKTRKAGIGW